MKKELREHVRLVRALTSCYNAALVLRAKQYNPDAEDFGDAIKYLPPEIFHEIRESFRLQMEKINSREGETG